MGHAAGMPWQLRTTTTRRPQRLHCAMTSPMESLSAVKPGVYAKHHMLFAIASSGLMFLTWRLINHN